MVRGPERHETGVGRGSTCTAKKSEDVEAPNKYFVSFLPDDTSKCGHPNDSHVLTKI